MGRTSAMLAVSVLTLVVNLGLLFILVPRIGINGVAIALLASHLAALAYLTWKATRLLQMRVRDLLPVVGLTKVAAAALAAGALIAPAFWTDTFGLPGAMAASTLYGVVFAGLLLLVRLPEALDLRHRIISQMLVSLARLRARST